MSFVNRRPLVENFGKRHSGHRPHFPREEAEVTEAGLEAGPAPDLTASYVNALEQLWSHRLLPLRRRAVRNPL